MGCGSSSNQVHEVNSPTPINNKVYDKQQDDNSICNSKCYLFGQSSGERKVVFFNSNKMSFSTLSSRLRIPTAKIKLQPIQILYQQSQQIILPDMMKKGPSPPFNFSFGTFCRKDIIFICGGINYQCDQVYSQSYFYNLNPPSLARNKSPGNSNSSQIANNKVYIKFQSTTSMNQRRYSHMGLYHCSKDKKNEYIYIFGGRNPKHQCMETCQRFDLGTRKWKQIAPMVTARSEGCAMSFLNKIYVFGGISYFRQYPQNIQVYEPSENSWMVLNIRLHRGIRSCLITSSKPNQILIFGGVTSLDKQQRRINSIIKVNLIEQTYIWQNNLPQKLAHIKYTYDSQNNKLAIFSNQTNLIYGYQLATRCWKNLSGSGYKSYVPVSDLWRFNCVGEPLDLKADLQVMKNLQNKQKQTTKRKQNSIIPNIHIWGNQNYPCMQTFQAQPESISIKSVPKQTLHPISMRLYLKSNMNIVALSPNQYFISGGCDRNQRYSFNETFLYNTALPSNFAIENLGSAVQLRHSAGIVHVDGQEGGGIVMLMGGMRNNGAILKSCEKYLLKQQRWQAGCNPLLKPLHNLKCFVLSPNKILIYSGKEYQNQPNTLFQVYNITPTKETNSKNQVISFVQFPTLSEGGEIMEMFVRYVNPKELEAVDLRQSGYLKEITNRGEIQRLDAYQSTKSNLLSKSKSPKNSLISYIEPSVLTQRKQHNPLKQQIRQPITVQLVKNKSPTFKDLILVHNIPESHHNLPRGTRMSTLINREKSKTKLDLQEQEYVEGEFNNERGQSKGPNKDRYQKQDKFSNKQKLEHKIMQSKPEMILIKPKQTIKQTIQNDTKIQRRQQKKDIKLSNSKSSKDNGKTKPIQFKQSQQQQIQLSLQSVDNTKKQSTLKVQQQDQIQLDQSEQNLQFIDPNMEISQPNQKHKLKQKFNQKKQKQLLDVQIQLESFNNDNSRFQDEDSYADREKFQDLEVKNNRRQVDQEITLADNIKYNKNLYKDYQVLRLYVYRYSSAQSSDQQSQPNPFQKSKSSNQMQQPQKVGTNPSPLNPLVTPKAKKNKPQIDNNYNDTDRGRLNTTGNVQQVWTRREELKVVNRVDVYNLLVGKKDYGMHLLKNKVIGKDAKDRKSTKNAKQQTEPHSIPLPQPITYTHTLTQKPSKDTTKPYTNYFLNLIPSNSSKSITLHQVTPQNAHKQGWVERNSITVDDRMANVKDFGEFGMFSLSAQFY